MVSEAQKRAAANYRKKSVKQVILKFYPGDAEMYEWVKAQGNATAYVKSLVAADMERRGGEARG
uniref:Uncharacterized protein n=1 Tax=Muribaculaceae bacterium Z82 TaxID=2304548 RepID=A0A7C9JRK3_9BACT